MTKKKRAMNEEERLDTAHIYYQTAREELLFHLEQRNQEIFWHLVALTTALSLGLSKDSFYIVLFLPLLAFGASLLTIQHDVHIGSLAAYCSNELEISLSVSNVVQWDKSISWRFFYPHFLNLRLFAHISLVLLPSVFSFMFTLIVYWDSIIKVPALVIWTILDLIVFLITLFLYFWGKRFRKKLEKVQEISIKDIEKSTKGKSKKRAKS